MAKEREAEEIIAEAKELAEVIGKNAQEKAEAVYRKTYQKVIDDAKSKSVEIKEHAKKDAESEAQVFIKRAEKMVFGQRLQYIGFY